MPEGVPGIYSYCHRTQPVRRTRSRCTWCGLGEVAFSCSLRALFSSRGVADVFETHFVCSGYL